MRRTAEPAMASTPVRFRVEKKSRNPDVGNSARAKDMIACYAHRLRGMRTGLVIRSSA